MTAYERVLKARAKGRPTSMSYIKHIFKDFIEMHGDRRFGDDKAIVSGIAMLDGKPVTVIGIEKGKDTKERIDRNFGSVHPEGYRKALRQMKLAEKFKYSDQVSSPATTEKESLIMAELDNLKDIISHNDEEQILSQIEIVSNLLSSRNRICEASKSFGNK